MASCGRDIVVRDLTVWAAQHAWFKAVGDEPSIAAYNAKVAPTHAADWGFLYLQPAAAHARGAIDYRWDQGYTCAAIRVSTGLRAGGELPLQRVLHVDAAWMGAADVPGQVKAAAVRAALGVDDETPLSEVCTRRGLALLVTEVASGADADELDAPPELAGCGAVELLLPHALVAGTLVEAAGAAVDTFQRPKYLGPP